METLVREVCKILSVGLNMKVSMTPIIAATVYQSACYKFYFKECCNTSYLQVLEAHVHALFPSEPARLVALLG